MSSDMFEQWDRELDDIDSDKQKLLDQMREQLEKGESSEVLYRLAKVNLFLVKLAEKSANAELEKTFAMDGLCYADKACKLDPNNKECHKWYCASVGKLANISSNKEKIKFGHEFKEHADIALAIDPYDHFMQLMYGQWCYSVAGLTWIERTVAKTIYGEPPKADYIMALKAFEKVNQLNPHSKECHLWLARVDIALKNNSEAKHWIKNGLSLQNRTVSDEIAHKELESLNTKYK